MLFEDSKRVSKSKILDRYRAILGPDNEAVKLRQNKLKVRNLDILNLEASDMSKVDLS